MLRSLTSVFRKVRLRGASGLWALLRDNVWNVRTCSVWTARLDPWAPCDDDDRPGVEAAKGSRAELAAFRQAWTGGPLPDAFYADLVYGLDTCFLGRCAGEIAHICWVTADRWTCNVHHAPDEWEVRDVFTLENYRGRGVAKRVLTMAIGQLKEDGAATVFAHVERGNRASEATMSAVGLHRIGAIRRTRLMGIERVTRSLTIAT